ncbi:MAG TPA: hypothetical protein VN364_06420 [Bellilinea sp.]|nr:hypothetical protein [Bellilinea sp.]
MPELRSSARLVFDQKRHPFYRHSKAQFFLAEQGKEVVGRIAVMHNRNYSDHYRQEVGFFYYFDVIDDQTVANSLLGAAVDWAREQGITSILGPRGFLRSQGFGLLIDGFDQLPAVGIPYNFPYYQTLLENYGFIKEADLLSGYMVPADELPEKVFTAADRVAERGNFKVIKFQSKRELKPWIPMVDFVYRNAFLDNPNYYPTTPEEFKLMAKTIYQIANPRLVKIITRDDTIAGFLLGYSNINHALQKTRGRMFPFGWITLLKAMQDTSHVDLNGLGLLPEYQGRGANMLLYAEVERTLRAVSAQFAEMVQVDERNFASFSDFINAGVHLFKRHRLYRFTL